MRHSMRGIAILLVSAVTAGLLTGCATGGGDSGGGGGELRILANITPVLTKGVLPEPRPALGSTSTRV
ncbi:hypothetical protein GCM10020220_090080 [Nonomuraea rubra]|uniref:hypothetical protein n=1 Tax=Nonomuraea rubra TaxID=46180 RepID=UPI0031E7430E